MRRTPRTDSAVSEGAVAATAPRRARIGYLPMGGITNAYAERFVEILGGLGTVTALPSPREILRRPWRLRRDYDVALVNWIELDMVRRGDGALSLPGLARVLARVLLLRCVARRVVYVRHNNFPHGTREADRERARRVLDRLERLFDAVLVHAGHAATPHRRYVPHPLYRRARETLAPAEAQRLAALPAHFYVVFGRIARYKGIDRLIERFPPGHALVVLGAVEEPDHVAALEAAAGPEVRIMAGHVSDAYAQAVLSRSTGLVLAHAEPDMIVSGSLFYALSLGVRVFAVENPALAWLRSQLEPGRLTLAPDVAALCARIATDHPPAPAAPAPEARLDEAFGDARIRGVLREVLFP